MGGRRKGGRPGDAAVAAADRAQGAAADAQIAVVKPVHRFTEGDGHQRGLTDRKAVVRHDNSRRRAHSVDNHARRRAQAVKGQNEVVASGITDAATIEVKTGADADAVGVVVARLDGVLEDQGRSAGTGHQIGEYRAAADIQEQPRDAVDQYCFADVDREGQGVAGIVGSSGRHADIADRGHHGIDQHTGGARHAVQAGDDVVADRITQGAAVGLDGRAQGDAIGVQLTAGRH